MNKTMSFRITSFGITFFGAVLALGSSAFTQGYVTTPKGGLRAEGTGSCHAFGWFADGRFQLADGTHRGSPFTITRISFRSDHRDHTAATAMGRTWTNISLEVSETTNFNRMSKGWEANITAAPTGVFDASWRWETQVGLPVLEPDAWGGAKGQLAFPFKKPWVYTGRNEILMDYVFRGGTLDNKATWNTSSSVSFFLDSRYIEWNRFRSDVQQIPGVRRRCGDSGLRNPSTSAFIEVWAYAYGASSPSRSRRGSLVVDGYSYYTAENSMVLHAFGLGGFTEGVDIGARCNSLYLDFSHPAALLPLKTGSNGYCRVPTLQAPWEPAFSELELFVQAAWTDTVTSELSLTNGVRLKMPEELPAPKIPCYKTCYNDDPDAKEALYPPVTSGHFFPYTRYDTK